MPVCVCVCGMSNNQRTHWKQQHHQTNNVQCSSSASECPEAHNPKLLVGKPPLPAPLPVYKQAHWLARHRQVGGEATVPPPSLQARWVFPHAGEGCRWNPMQTRPRWGWVLASPHRRPYAAGQYSGCQGDRQTAEHKGGGGSSSICPLPPPRHCQF